MTIKTTWQNTTVKLSALVPWDKNPKSIGAKQAKRLLDYWDRIGQFQTVAIGPADEQGKHPVYDGHQRLNVLLNAHGGDYVVSAMVCSRPLSENERAELTIQAHAGTTGQWDWEALASWEPVELQEWGLDNDYLSQLNQDTAAMIDMLGSEEEHETGEGADTEPEIDKAEEFRKKWGVKTGDLWGLGKITRCPGCGKTHKLD